MHSKHIEKINNLLRIIAKKGEVYQTEFAGLTGLSYRQVLRQLGLLKKSRLIRVKRTEPSSKRGKEKNVWELTFSGLLQVFAMTTTSESDFDLIAERNKAKWAIFEEWARLTEGKTVKKHVIFGIQKYALENSQKFRDYSEIRTYGNLQKMGEKEWPDFLTHHESRAVGGATISALRLDDVFSKGFVPKQILGQGNKSAPSPWERLWKVAIKNPKLRAFILEQIALEGKRHKRILDFREWLFPNEALDFNKGGRRKND